MVTKYGPPYFYVGLAEKEAKLAEVIEELHNTGVLGVPVKTLSESEIQVLAEQHAPLNAQETKFEKKVGRPITLTERRMLKIENEEN